MIWEICRSNLTQHVSWLSMRCKTSLLIYVSMITTQRMAMSLRDKIGSRRIWANLILSSRHSAWNYQYRVVSKVKMEISIKRVEWFRSFSRWTRLWASIWTTSMRFLLDVTSTCTSLAGTLLSLISGMTNKSSLSIDQISYKILNQYLIRDILTDLHSSSNLESHLQLFKKINIE